MEKFVQLQLMGSTLTMTLHRPAEELGGLHEYGRKFPVVVICHGFVGSRIGVNRLFVNVSQLFEQSGFVVVRFDYSGCGESTGNYGATGLSSMIEQTQCVLDYVCSLDFVDINQITLLGHSLGGAVAVLTAAANPLVQNLVLWSAVAQPFEEIQSIVGETLLHDFYRSGNACYLGYRFLPVFFESLKQHNPLEAASRFRGKALVIHGTSDEEIPVSNCSLYLEALGSNATTCRAEVLRNADHTYSSGYSSEALRALTLEWLQEVHVIRNNFHVG